MRNDNPNSGRNPDGTFKKGYTANPRGAPPKAKRKRPSTAFDILQDEAFNPVASDLPSDLALEDEAAFRTLKAAFGGSKRARRQILKHIMRRAEERIRAAKENEPHHPVKRLVELDPSNADEVLVLLQIAQHDPEEAHPTDRSLRLKLLPWAVQAALGRRNGGRRLNRQEIDQIKLRTADAKEIRWPRGYLDRAEK